MSRYAPGLLKKLETYSMVHKYIQQKQRKTKTKHNWKQHQCYINTNTIDVLRGENWFHLFFNVVHKMAAILSRYQCVKLPFYIQTSAIIQGKLMHDSCPKILVLSLWILWSLSNYPAHWYYRIRKTNQMQISKWRYMSVKPSKITGVSSVVSTAGLA